MQRDSDAGPASDTAVTFVDFDRADPNQDRAPQATLSAAATLVRAFGAEASEPRIVDPHEGAARSFDPGTRYENRRVLGEGGMGEVRLCADSFVGREVAMKVIRAGGGTFPDAQKRFLREARVQGQLEHPAIVPVYDIGVTSARETFFTMKRIVGRTLEEIITGLARGDETLISRFPLRKLLSAFSQVTLALAFAHSKGVVHRDLKPANIMLGDFGEVYVLDWGIAKVANSDDLPSPSAKESETPVAGTQAGSLLGTPGYMSPEQARGEASACDHRADIYALGAILYEVLALAPMHRSKSFAELVVAAMCVDGARPSSERIEVPSVLDGICYRATRLDPRERFESARELHDALESFLDGERDRERRQEIADVHTSRAEELLRQPDDEGDSEARRTEIMRELGSALILDPAHRRARRALLQVLVDEPDTIPPEAEKELDDINRKDRSQSALGAALTYLGWFLLLPIGLWMGVQKPLWVIALGATNLLFVGFMIWMWRTQNASPPHMRFAIMGNFILISFLAIFFGPLILLPQAVSTLSASLMVSIRANRVTRRFIAFLGIGAVLAPVFLEMVGVLPVPYSFENGALLVHPFAVDFRPLPTMVFLIVTTAFSLITPALLIGRGVEVLIASERRTVARAYRLRQLLPNVEPAVASQR